MQSRVGLELMEIGGTVAGAIDHLGNFFPLDSCAMTYGYDAATGSLTTETATLGTNTWLRTYTYNASTGKVATATLWMKQ